MKYIILGDPQALARPRLSQKGIYDSQRNLKLVAGINLRNQHGDKPIVTGPIHLSVNFYLKIPLGKKNHENRPHIYTPDLSNLLKFVEDSANGIIFGDDKQICAIECGKYYSENPRTEFTVTKVKI